MDSAEFGEDVVAKLRETVGDELRSVVGYTRDGYAVHYVRDDVAALYTDEEIEQAIAEMRLETLEKNYLNTVFQRRHGELYSRVVVFEHAVELNFAVGEGEGLAVAVDTAHFAREDDLVKTVVTAIDEYASWEVDDS